MSFRKKAQQIAKRMANEFATKEKPRFVAGSIGPTTKLPSLGHIAFDIMRESYYGQMAGLLDGGADLFIIETCQDLLQIKAALAAAQDLFRDKRTKIPVITSVTIETMGTMLMGTEIGAALDCARTLRYYFRYRNELRDRAERDGRKRPLSHTDFANAGVRHAECRICRKISAA